MPFPLSADLFIRLQSDYSGFALSSKREMFGRSFLVVAVIFFIGKTQRYSNKRGFNLSLAQFFFYLVFT